MRIKRVNHVGVLVEDLSQAVEGFSEVLALPVTATENYRQELQIAFLSCGDTQVELLQPLSQAGDAAAWLRRHGPGIQHIAFEVDDLQAALQTAARSGVGTLGDGVRPGAGNTVIAFLDPSPFGGILVELCQRANAPAG